jgi:hypothetical protein
MWNMPRSVWSGAPSKLTEAKVTAEVIERAQELLSESQGSDAFGHPPVSQRTFDTFLD